MENFPPGVYFDGGGQAEDDGEAEGEDGEAVGGEEKAGVCGVEGEVAEVFCRGEGGGGEGRGVEERGERNPGGEVPSEDLETEGLDVAEEVADGPAEGLVVVEGGLADEVADGTEDEHGDEEVEVCGVEPFSVECLRGGQIEEVLGDGLCAFALP